MDTKQLYRGKGLVLYDNVVVKHPTLGQIFDKYDKHMSYLSLIISSSLDVADILWVECQIFYEDIKSEWEFFIQKSLADTRTADLYVMENNQFIKAESDVPLVAKEYADALNYFIGTTGEWIVLIKSIGDTVQHSLYNLSYIDDKLVIRQDCVIFTEQSYHALVDYLKKIHLVKTEYKFLNGGTKKARKYLLTKYYQYQRNSKDKPAIDIESIVSALITLHIFSYKEIWDIPIYVIYDCYFRQTKITEYKDTMHALYSGCIDTKKNPVNFEKIHWASILE